MTFRAVKKRLFSDRIQNTHKFKNMVHEHGSVLIDNETPLNSYTSRTTAFKTATGITDPVILNALNVSDLDLTAKGLDNGVDIIYPFVGGTSNTCKYNFINPVDSDVAFRASFYGGLSVDNYGVKGNALNTYIDSHYNSYRGDNQSVGFYSRTDTIDDAVDFGAVSSTLGYSGISFYSSKSTPLFGGSVNSDLNQMVTTNPMASTAGFFLITRTGQDYYIYKNGLLFYHVNANNSIVNSVYNLFFLNRNTDGAPDSYYSDKQLAYCWVGRHLNSSEQLDLYNNVQTLQTSLSRQV